MRSPLLEPFFTPRAVALVGSVGEGKLGYELLRQMLAGGYRDVVAVNPKGQGALGVAGLHFASQPPDCRSTSP